MNAFDFPCVIIETSESDDWTPAWNAPSKIIPQPRRPTMLQPDRETAEREAVRLAAAHPGKRFVVFSPVSVGLTIKVPSHVTMSGRTFMESERAVLAKLGDVDGECPPF